MGGRKEVGAHQDDGALRMKFKNATVTSRPRRSLVLDVCPRDCAEIGRKEG
jgi:hypothetical protein